MYLNDLMTDDELINAAQYAESRHLRLLAERLDARRDDIKGVLDTLSDDDNDDADMIEMARSEIRDILAK